jgi:hypothetical protein
MRYIHRWPFILGPGGALLAGDGSSQDLRNAVDVPLIHRTVMELTAPWEESLVVAAGPSLERFLRWVWMVNESPRSKERLLRRSAPRRLIWPREMPQNVS